MSTQRLSGAVFNSKTKVERIKLIRVLVLALSLIILVVIVLVHFIHLFFLFFTSVLCLSLFTLLPLARFSFRSRLPLVSLSLEK